MKKLKLLTAVVVAVVIGAGIFYACQKESMSNLNKSYKNIPNPEPNPPLDNYFSFDNYAMYGELHNIILGNIIHNFNEDEDFFVEEDQVMNYIANLINENSNEFLPDEVYDLLPEKLEIYKYLSYTPCLYEICFHFEGGIIKYFDEMHAFGIIDEFELSSFNEIFSLAKNNFEGNVTNEEVVEYFRELKLRMDEQGYEETSSTGKLLGIVVGISLSSSEFWEQNIDIQYTYPCYALPAVVVTDGIGAAVGGGIEAYRTYKQEGAVNWKDVGWSALEGGVSASIGGSSPAGKAVVKCASNLISKGVSVIKKLF